MNDETYNLLKDNYLELFNNYCKYQDKHKIKNGRNCEDVFNDKILYFVDMGINPTLENLNKVISGSRKDRQFLSLVHMIDIEEKIEETIEYKLKLLFIDYSPKKEIKL